MGRNRGEVLGVREDGAEVFRRRGGTNGWKDIFKMKILVHTYTVEAFDGRCR